MAWLNTAPERPKAPQKANVKRSSFEPPEPTRLDSLMKRDLQPDLPDPGPAAHLIDYLFDMGPVMSGGMGPVPLSHSEIQAWQQNTGVELRAWEASTLRRLSIEYLSTSADARDPSCPAPFTVAPQEDRRTVVARMIGATLGARAKAERMKAST
jgi:hypothetical protein